MQSDLHRDLLEALERPHRLGTIGGDLEEQLAHCASFSSVLAEVSPPVDDVDGRLRGIDLGTGGGLPGVALAIYRPDMDWTLVDMRTARADEVERTILRLQLQHRVEVIGTQAQLLGHDDEHREQYDVAVARAFGAPSIAAECAAGVLGSGGVFIVSEPPEPDASEDVAARWDTGGLVALGFALPQFRTVEGSRFAILRKESASPEHIPRLPPRNNRGWLKP